MFYTFSQNNSGGYFCGPRYVIIEADSGSEANHIAQNHPDSPIYFDGCSTGQDCSCCGDRWYETRDEAGKESPEIYGDDDISRYGSGVLVIRKEIKTSETQREKIAHVLVNSDIVWTKYGSETIEQLTEKIVKVLTNQ